MRVVKGNFSELDLKDGESEEFFNPIRPGGGSVARMAKLTAANQKPLIL